MVDEGQHVSEGQAATREAFSYKWAKRDTYDSPAVRNEWRRWLLEKYFDSSEAECDDFLSGEGLRILDAGCGAGISALLLFGQRLSRHSYVGVDISDSIHQAQDNFIAAGIPGDFIQDDISHLPASLGEFDRIFSEGVLHHTDSVEDTLMSLTRHLRRGGLIAFYVYSRKAPMREFADDYIRERISSLDEKAAWDLLLPLTRLGKALGDLNVTVDIEEDIELLSIPKGRYDLQRLFYYKFFKAYYRSDYSIEEMNHINFDWYRPMNCHRHTPEEIMSYCQHADLEIVRLNEEASGITCIASKR